MRFSFLKEACEAWEDLLVIGKTIERDTGNYHILGMTCGDATKLYVIEPYAQGAYARRKRTGARTHRRLEKELPEQAFSYLHCSDFYLGQQRLCVSGGTAQPMGDASQEYGMLQLFFAMLRAGWRIPPWLECADWGNLQLVILEIARKKKLPHYSPEMQITIRHRASYVRHLLEKTVTLQVGKSRSFCFMDEAHNPVQCYINAVTLIDPWQAMQDQLAQLAAGGKASPEQLRTAEQQCAAALAQSCPRGARYVGVEYECSRDISLQFYAKAYLKASPAPSKAQDAFLMMRLTPEQKTGAHGLMLRGCVLQTPVPPDTAKIPAEAFCYFEKTEAWEETV